MRLAILGAAMLLCTPTLAAQTSPACVSPDLAMERAKAFAQIHNIGALATISTEGNEQTLTIYLQGISEPVVVRFKDGCLVVPDDAPPAFGPAKVHI